MGWFMLAQLFSTLLERVLLPRPQLAILERQLDKPLPVSRAEPFTLARLAGKLKSTTGNTVQQLHEGIRIFQPDTVLQWQRERVGRKWTSSQRQRLGRPKTDAQ